MRSIFLVHESLADTKGKSAGFEVQADLLSLVTGFTELMMRDR